MTIFKTMSNLDLVNEIYHNDNIKIVHKYGDDRLVQDIAYGLELILEEYEDFKYTNKEIEEERNAMLKHINKLEKMLDRRGVNYKTWEEVGIFL